jgi:hypothetical protein
MTGDLKDLEGYLADLDNLIDTGHFQGDAPKDYTFRHQDMNLKEFMEKGREIIKQSLQRLQGKPEWLIYENAEIQEEIKAEKEAGHVADEGREPNLNVTNRFA